MSTFFESKTLGVNKKKIYDNVSFDHPEKIKIEIVKYLGV